MQIHLYRHPGCMGRFAKLDVLLNGQRIGSIKGKETLDICLPEEGGVIQLVMQGFVASPAYTIPANSNGFCLECGTPLWVLFDVFSLAYLPFFRKRVFFLRKDQRNAHTSTAQA